MRNFVLVTALLGLGSFPARACDCLRQSTMQNYRRADFVLRVHIEVIQDTVQYDLYSNPGRPPFAAGAYVQARVQRVYKGACRDKELIISGAGDMCDYRFARGGDTWSSYTRQTLTHWVCTERLPASDISTCAIRWPGGSLPGPGKPKSKTLGRV